jgi:hypothetical protein
MLRDHTCSKHTAHHRDLQTTDATAGRRVGKPCAMHKQHSQETGATEVLVRQRLAADDTATASALGPAVKPAATVVS